MFRLGALRPLLESASSRLPTRQKFSPKSFSTFRMNGGLQKKSTNIWTPGTFGKSARSYMTQRPIVQQAQGISWQRMGMTAVSRNSLLRGYTT